MELKGIVTPAPMWALVKLVEEKKSNSRGIYLPDNTEKTELIMGNVSVLGETRKEETFPCDITSTVIFDKWAGRELKIDGEDYKLIKAEDIIAVVEEK